MKIDNNKTDDEKQEIEAEHICSTGRGFRAGFYDVVMLDKEDLLDIRQNLDQNILFLSIFLIQGHDRVPVSRWW